MKFILYVDRQGKWRWKLIGHNNGTIAEAGEGYNGIGNVRRALKAFKHAVTDAKVIEQQEEDETTKDA